MKDLNFIAYAYIKNKGSTIRNNEMNLKFLKLFLHCAQWQHWHGGMPSLSAAVAWEKKGSMIGDKLFNSEEIKNWTWNYFYIQCSVATLAHGGKPSLSVAVAWEKKESTIGDKLFNSEEIKNWTWNYFHIVLSGNSVAAVARRHAAGTAAAAVAWGRREGRQQRGHFYSRTQ